MQQHETSAIATWSLMKPLQRSSNPHLLQEPVKGPLRGPTAIPWDGSVIHLSIGRCVQMLSQMLEKLQLHDHCFMGILRGKKKKESLYFVYCLFYKSQNKTFWKPAQIVTAIQILYFSNLTWKLPTLCKESELWNTGTNYLES